MGHYIMNFTVYTLAMSGLICFALFVYKKVMNGGFSSKSSKMLEIEETMNVNPRKSLMIVRAGDERFLIASDIDRTSLISKLSDDMNYKKTDSYISNIKNNVTLLKNEDLETIYPTSNKDEIHLELIKDNNPQSPRIKRKINSKEMSTGKMVTIDFDTPKNYRMSTMKEMAKKINEL